MKCSKCGKQLPQDSEFCQYCGNKVEVFIEENPLQQDERNCHKCGSKIPSDSEFCPYCGSKVILDFVNSKETEPQSKTIEAGLEDFIAIAVSHIRENKASGVESKWNNDPEYGLIVEKPIFTKWIDEQKKYVNSLCTAQGESLEWQRLGSTHCDGISGQTDIYLSTLKSGETYKTIYVNMYGSETSTTAPQGFSFKKNLETNPQGWVPAPQLVKKTEKPTRNNQEKTKPKKARGIIALCIILVVALCGVGVYGYPEYQKDLSLIEDAMDIPNYDWAEELYEESIWLKVGDPKLGKYIEAWNLFYEERYGAAEAAFKELGKYREASDIAPKVLKYQEADRSNDCVKQYKTFKSLGSFADSAKRAKEAQSSVYFLGQNKFNEGNFVKAKEYFQAVKTYMFSDAYIDACNGFIKLKGESYATRRDGLECLREAQNFVDIEKWCMSEEYIDYFLDGYWIAGQETFTYDVDTMTFNFENCFYLPNSSYYFTPEGMTDKNSRIVVNWLFVDADAILMWEEKYYDGIPYAGVAISFSRSVY